MLRLAISGFLLSLAVFVVLGKFGTEAILTSMKSLSVPALLLLFVALLLNAIAASARLQTLARDMGYEVNFRQAMLTVGAGSLGGAVFFQLAGQLIARSAVLSRHNISPASVVFLTGYERAASAFVAATLALLGAYILFSGIVITQPADGFRLLKTVIGLGLATLAGAAIGFPNLAHRLVASLARRSAIISVLKMVALSVLVQAPMMAAYIVIIMTLSPQTPLLAAFAATAVVMFAASIPISFAGWGIREISAVVALGAIGIGAADALVIAVTVGLGALLTMTLIVVSNLPRSADTNEKISLADSNHAALNVNYETTLLLLLPLLISILLAFQIHIPVRSSLLNVNLADPLAILAGPALVYFAIRSSQSNALRHTAISVPLLGMTFAMTLALAIGIASFGLTPWAMTNRYIGWYLLLCYFSVGALCSQRFGATGVKMLGLTLAGAIAAIVLLDVLLMLIGDFGIRVPRGLRVTQLEGFAQNRNAFSFQILIAFAFVVVFARNARARMTLLLILCSGILIAGSRAGWGAFAVLLAIGAYCRRLSVRELIAIAVLTVAIVLASWANVSGGLGSSGGIDTTFNQILFPNETTMNERIYTLAAAWDLFTSHPVFGAGLGAFVSQEMLLHQRQLVIHSTLLWMLAELGLVGTAFFIVPAIALAVRCIRLAHGGDRIATLLVLVFAAFGTMSLVHDMLFQRMFWLVLGAGVPLILLSQDGERCGALDPARGYPVSASWFGRAY